jgi:thiamine pyrophosphate-dependent acetolactate synthase large subunit-like protein
MGVHAAEVATADQVKPVIHEALQFPGPFLIDLLLA